MRQLRGRRRRPGPRRAGQDRRLYDLLDVRAASSPEPAIVDKSVESCWRRERLRQEFELSPSRTSSQSGLSVTSSDTGMWTSTAGAMKPMSDEPFGLNSSV